MSTRMNRSGLTRRSLSKRDGSRALGLSGASLLSAGRVPRRRLVRKFSLDRIGCVPHEGGEWAHSRHPALGKGPPSHTGAGGILDSVYSPTRIKYPMVRRAFLEHGHGADPDGRGDGDYVRVTWDQALDLVVKELQRWIGPMALPLRLQLLR